MVTRGQDLVNPRRKSKKDGTQTLGEGWGGWLLPKRRGASVGEIGGGEESPALLGANCYRTLRIPELRAWKDPPEKPGNGSPGRGKEDPRRNSP